MEIALGKIQKQAVARADGIWIFSAARERSRCTTHILYDQFIRNCIADRTRGARVAGWLL